MKSAEAIKWFGNQTLLADALGITQGSVSKWGDKPPALWQLRIQHLTMGRLVADPEAIQPKRKSAPKESNSRCGSALIQPVPLHMGLTPGKAKTLHSAN